MAAEAFLKGAPLSLTDVPEALDFAALQAGKNLQGPPRVGDGVGSRSGERGSR